MFVYILALTCISVLVCVLRMWCRPVEDRQCYRLQWLYIGMGMLHLVSTTSMAWFVAQDHHKWRVPLYTHLDSEDVHNLSLPVAQLTVLFGLFTGVWHIIVSMWRPHQLQHAIERGQNIYRWSEYALTSTMMIVVIACLAGVTDTYVVVGIASVQWYLMLQSYVIESDLAKGYMEELTEFTTRGKWALLRASVLYVVGVWVPIWGYFHPTLARSSAPDWVQSMVWILFVLFAFFPVVMVYYLVWHVRDDATPSTKTRHMMAQELAYIALSLTCKVALQWILYMGIQGRQENRNINSTLIASIVCIIGCLVYIVSRVYILQVYPRAYAKRFLF